MNRLAAINAIIDKFPVPAGFRLCENARAEIAAAVVDFKRHRKADGTPYKYAEIVEEAAPCKFRKNDELRLIAIDGMPVCLFERI